MGFTSFFAEQLRGAEAIHARIASEHRKRYEVWTEEGECSAQLAGRLYQELDAEARPAVGDWVTLKAPLESGQTAIIERVLKRRTAFTRGAAGREAREQVIAANVDIIFAVTGLDSDFSIHRIERYLSRIWASGALPVIILNKADLCPDVQARLTEVEEHCPGAQILVTSSFQSDSLEEIRKLITDGQTAAFVGSSGVGKSTLINALIGEERMPTQEVMESDGRGRHTTTHRQLILLPSGGLLLDTPGMRELQLLDEEGIDLTFADIDSLSANCRFSDCGHESEPGCAVREAVSVGDLSAERLEHYLKLKQESRSYEIRHDEHLRRKSERVWGQLQKEGNLIRRLKSG